MSRMSAGERGRPAVRLRLAGTFAVERSGVPDGAEVVGGKAGLVLRMLAAARGRFVPMDTLIEELWGDDPPVKATANVATLVSRLRRSVGRDAIEGGRAGYRLVPGHSIVLDVDEAENFVAEAEARLAAGQPALALTAARAALDLLGDGGVLDDHRHAEWAAEVGREAARLLRRARATGWRASAALGQERGALAFAEDAVAADDLDEEAHRAVMELYHRLGESGEALRAYERLRVTLLDQLGADPGPETVAVYDAILRAEPIAREPADEAVAPASSSGFVGRDREMAQLIAAWSSACSGAPGCALVLGEAGIGKTRLVTELARRVDSSGGLVLHARCYELERSLFLQPIVELVRAAVTSVAPEVIARAADRPGPLAALVPELEELIGPVAYQPAAGAIERRRTFEAVASFFAGLARQRPLLLVVDDLHDAGASTVELLHFARRWDPGSAVLILATARSDEVVTTLGELETVAVRIDLGPLPPEAIRSLARDAGTPDSADAVIRMTRGHTLFVVEALRELADRDPSQPAGELPVPQSLRSAIETRVRRCGEEVEAFLRAAVVAGSPFDLAPVADLLSEAPEEVAAFAERARRAGVLVATGTGYEFANDLMRDVLYDTTPSPVRAMRHRRLAELLEDRPAVAARHAAAAGDWTAAASLWLQAGALAVATLATREAEQLFTEALNAAALGEDPRTTADAQLGRGRVRAMLGDYRAGAEDLTAAQQLARAIGASTLAAQAMVELGWCAYYARDLRRASEIAERVGASPAAGPAGQILFAKIRHTAGDLRTAMERLEPVVAGDDDPARRAMALAALAKVIAHHDDYARAGPMLDEAMTACRHAGLLRSLLASRMVVILTRGNLGQFAVALAGAESLLEDVERYEVPVYRPRALNMAAWAWRELGDLSRSRDLATEALEACGMNSAAVEGEPAANSMLALAESALLVGDEAECGRWLAEIDSLLADHVGYGWRIELRRLEILCRMDPSRGEELLAAARSHLSAKYEALALHHLRRTDLAVDVARRTGSPWLLARVASGPVARENLDELAALLPEELRGGFLTRGPLARQLAP